ncbi:CHAP domain-containing protein [Candidatus Pacearchaeota archaeon]|jgi:hypothetical protein|nr:CHAP domain-containing protein [Candidatus Pacearchaeota archaeon]
MTTAQDVLALARAEIGAPGSVESPLGSNSGTKYHAWYGGVQGYQWCAIFQSWLFRDFGFRSYYTGDWINWGVRNGLMVLAPQPGAICVMDRYPYLEQGGISDHVGIIESVNGAARTMTLIEGNYNDRVARVTRPLDGSTKYYFILPRYSQAQPKTQEAEVSTQSSAGRVTSFPGIYYIGIMDGRPWDVWAKAQNPTPNPISARVVAVTNDVPRDPKTVAIGPNQIVQVQVGKEMGCKGNTLVTIEPSVPAVCTFDHRPTG